MQKQDKRTLLFVFLATLCLFSGCRAGDCACPKASLQELLTSFVSLFFL